MKLLSVMNDSIFVISLDHDAPGDQPITPGKILNHEPTSQLLAFDNVLEMAHRSAATTNAIRSSYRFAKSSSLRRQSLCIVVLGGL
jgi:hypothetical protein